jgi:hypothetical protein
MKKTLLFLLASLAVLASCQPKEPEKPADPTLSVKPESIVIEAIGGFQTINVEANNSWTAELTSGTEWLTISTSASSFSVTASANPTHQNRMGSVTVKSDKLSKVVSVTQLASPNNDRIMGSPGKMTFEAAGGSQDISIDATVQVTATPSESWISVTPGSVQPGQSKITVTVAEYKGSTVREGSVTLAGGDATVVSVRVIQNPAAYITANPDTISAAAEGGEFTVSVSSNVSWTATAVPDWASVSPSGGQNAELKVSIAPNGSSEERTGGLVLSGSSAQCTIGIVQAATSATETLLATWRCDDAAYTDSHSPDWSTPGANDYSHGSGLGIALPEEGAPAGTQMTWIRNTENEFPLVYITAAEGHFAVKSTAANDGFLFSIPGQNLKKGQVISIDCGLASGANTLPKNWVAKFRTSESEEWVVGECSNAFTTNSGVIAHIQFAKTKDYTSHSRFVATHTVPADASGATIQIFVCAADGETIKGNTASGSTIRLIPLYNIDNVAEYPGPRISIR